MNFEYKELSSIPRNGKKWEEMRELIKITMFDGKNLRLLIKCKAYFYVFLFDFETIGSIAGNLISKVSFLFRMKRIVLSVSN